MSAVTNEDTKEGFMANGGNGCSVLGDENEYQMIRSSDGSTHFKANGILSN